ncbi:hypothetical protein ACU686_20495 [Yinghuangia aomiensis]
MQVLIYIGAVVVLLLFGLMLTWAPIGRSAGRGRPAALARAAGRDRRRGDVADRGGRRLPRHLPRPRRHRPTAVAQRHRRELVPAPGSCRSKC